MRFLTIILGITLAASAAGAEALGTSSGAPATPDETVAPEQAAAASDQTSEPAVTLTISAATTTTSVLMGAVAALSPAVTLVSTGAIAISANNPFDGGDDDESVATTAAPAVAPVAPVAPTVAPAVAKTDATDAGDASDGDEGETIVAAAPPTKVALPAKAPTEQELRLQYQRVGRDLLKLQDQRGKFDCGGVTPRFKAIKLDQALASSASRMQLYVDLTDMALKIDRLRGIHIAAECLQNPLASGCM